MDPLSTFGVVLGLLAFIAAATLLVFRFNKAVSSHAATIVDAIPARQPSISPEIELGTAKVYSLRLYKQVLWEPLSYYLDTLGKATIVRRESPHGTEVMFTVENGATKMVVELQLAKLVASTLEAEVDMQSYVKDGVVEVASDFQITVPIDDPAIDEIWKRWVNLLDPLVVNFVTPNTVPDNRVRVLELLSSKYGEVFQPVAKRCHVLDDTMLEASYEPIHIHHKGEPWKIGVGSIAPSLIQALLSGQNIIITGKPGTGKTTLMMNLVRRAKQMAEDLQVVRLNRATLEKIGQPEGKTALLNAISGYEDEFAPSIFMFDEAQAASDANAMAQLLELMEGVDSYPNSSVIAILNTDEMEPATKALLRNGRANVVIDLSPLSQKRIDNLTALISSRNPDLNFSATLLAKMVSSEDSVNGSIPTPKGTLSLCDVWACFTPKELDDLLMVALRSKGVSLRPPHKQITQVQQN